MSFIPWMWVCLHGEQGGVGVWENYVVYDINQPLSAAGHKIGKNAINM